MEQLKTFCRLYHKDNNIPIYLYEDKRLLCTFPEQPPLTYPPEKYSQILFSSETSVSYCASDYGIYFGAVRQSNENNLILILGPVSPIPYSMADLHKMYADYVVPSDQREDFQQFLQMIPGVSLSSFTDKLIFLNYCLNQECLTSDEILNFSPTGYTQEKQEDVSYPLHEPLTHNESYIIESVIMNLVRTGNLEGC